MAAPKAVDPNPAFGHVPSSQAELGKLEVHVLNVAGIARALVNRYAGIGADWLRMWGKAPWTNDLRGSIDELKRRIQELDTAVEDLNEVSDRPLFDSGALLKACQDVMIASADALDSAKKFERIAKASRPATT